MTVRMGLLALLDAGPSHGYQLKAAFEARTGGVWPLNVGQVYTTLERLRADGLVEALPVEEDADGSGRDRRPWQLTTAGKAAVDDWFDAPAVDAAPPREEFLAKVLLAIGRSPTHAFAVIDRQRTELYRLAQQHRRSRRRTDPPDADPVTAIAADLMAEVVAARHEADLRWLDHCEAVLHERLPEGPQP